jgi:hypothetical protein
MSPLPTTKRLRTTGLAFAAIMTLSWQGTMLMGFDRIAERGDRSQPDTTVLAQQTAERAVVTLERVVVTTRRA